MASKVPFLACFGDLGVSGGFADRDPRGDEFSKPMLKISIIY
jgi:hypothetical protein